jgi:hypothetical protein
MTFALPGAIVENGTTPVTAAGVASTVAAGVARVVADPIVAAAPATTASPKTSRRTVIAPKLSGTT